MTKDDQQDIGGVIKPRSLSKNQILSRIIEAERILKALREILTEEIKP